MAHKSNMRVMKLDSKALYKQVTVEKKVPFYEWNAWLKNMIEKLEFENIYKKKTEYEYSKMLNKKYSVKDSYF